jgi:predicted P-loop ATPase/GTPase
MRMQRKVFILWLLHLCRLIFMESNEITESTVFRLDSRRSPKEVKLLNLEWAVVTQLDGEKTVGEISEILALSRREVLDIFENLLKEHLLELVTVSPDEVHVPAEVFTEIEYQLTVLVGPVSAILFEDVLRAMRKSRQEFEIANLPVLVDLLTILIDDPDKQLVFQKNIYPRIRPYIL